MKLYMIFWNNDVTKPRKGFISNQLRIYKIFPFKL